MKLICPECRRENEPERIYCHDCGARLDRSGLTKEKAAPAEEDSKETQRRVAALFDPRRGLLRQRFFQASKLILGALFLAAIVQMLRGPELPERPKLAALPPQINIDLENATEGRVPALRYSDDQVTAYLAYALRGKQAALSKYLKFERVVVGFEEGSTDFTVERSLFGYSVFTSESCSASIENGNIVTKSIGGHIGRMPIHPALMQCCGFLFTDLNGALERERKLISKMGSIEFHPHLVVLASKTPPQT